MLGVKPSVVALLTVFAFVACTTSENDGAAPAAPTGDDDDDAGGKKKKDGGADGADPGVPTTGAIRGTVKSYSYAFDVTTTKATAKLTVDVPAPGGDCYTVGCRTSDAQSVMWNDAAPKSSTFDAGKLAVCGPPMAAGTTEISAVIPSLPTQTYFDLDIGFSRKTDLAGGEFSYVLSWVGGCDLFGPCDADPSRLSELHFEITHPEGAIVLCPGKLTAGATTTKCDIAGTLAPTYSGFGIAMDSKWQKTAYTSAAGVNVVMYEAPGGTIAANTDKTSYGEFLTWITGLLGPMPYGDELRFAGGPTVWLGFEHPANIILDENLGNTGQGSANSAQHVMMHETVHQWSGDRTTIASTSDFVWKEAIAEYLSYVFEDEHRPAGEATATREYWDSIAVNVDHRPRPTDNPAVQDFYGDVYGAGPMVLFLQLEPLLGRPAVLDGIKSFLSVPGAKSVDDLRSELGKAGGKDLTKYFAAWVVGPGAPEWPKFDVTTSQVGNQLTVSVTQNNASNVIYGCKLDVDINGKRATVDFGTEPTNKTASTTITFTGTPSPITVDPDHRVVNRPGNQGILPSPKPKVWIY
jgi:aminopeptidase N